METDAEKIAHLVQGLRDDFKELKQSKQVNSPSVPGASSNVNFNVNAGSAGLRLAVMLSAIMFVLMVCGIGFSIYTASQQSSRIAEIQRSTQNQLDRIKDQQSREQDYMNVILQWSSELRKKISEEKKNERSSHHS